MWAILDVSSMKMTSDLIKLLNIEYGPKDFTVSMPKLNDQLTWAFIRALFEGDGHVYKINGKSKRCKIVISSVSYKMKSSVNKFVDKFDISSRVYHRAISFHGTNAIKLINFMYNNSNDKLCLPRKKDMCLLWKEKEIEKNKNK